MSQITALTSGARLRYRGEEVSRSTHTRVHSSRYSSPSLRSSAQFHTGNLDCSPQDSTWGWQQAGYQNPPDALPPGGRNTASHISTVKTTDSVWVLKFVRDRRKSSSTKYSTWLDWHTWLIILIIFCLEVLIMIKQRRTKKNTDISSLLTCYHLTELI